jgi:signal transduction histidine kinase
LLVSHDVTQQRRAEAELRVLADELRQAKEVAEQASQAKDRFLKTVSHELRTPLTPVLLQVSVLEKKAENMPQLAPVIAMIRRNVEIEAKLVDDLLNFSRVSSDTGGTDIAAVADASLVVARAIGACIPDAARMRIAVDTDLRASQHLVIGDPEQLHDAVCRLLRNAIGMTPEGGHVRVWTHDGVTNRVLIGVSDGGPGMSDDEIVRFFEPFERGGRPGAYPARGLGLGLSISKCIVEACGGTLKAYSDGKGHGATFVIELQSVADLSQVALGLGPA